MSVTDFFQYLLDHEGSSHLGGELLAVYVAHVELAHRQPAGVAPGR